MAAVFESVLTDLKLKKKKKKKENLNQPLEVTI